MFVWFAWVRPLCRWDLLCLSDSSVCALKSFRFVVRSGDRLVPLGSFGSYGRTLEVVGFDWVLLLRPGTPWGSLYSSGFVCFLWVCTGIATVVRGLVRKGEPLGSQGSFRFVWFARVRPGGRWGSSGSSCLFGFTLMVNGFLLVRLDCSGAPWWSLGSFSFVRVRPRVDGFIWVRLFRLGAP